MHRFALGGYLIQITKVKWVGNYFQEKDVSHVRGKVVELVTFHPWEV